MAEGGGKLPVDDDAQFTCLICGQAGMTEESMRSHIMMDHVDQDVCCPFCDLSGITANEMNLHVNKVHLEEYKSPSKEVNGEIPMEDSNKLSPYSDEEKADTESPEKENRRKFTTQSDVIDHCKTRTTHSDVTDHSKTRTPMKCASQFVNKRSNSTDELSRRSKLNLDITSSCNSSPIKHSTIVEQGFAAGIMSNNGPVGSICSQLRPIPQPVQNDPVIIPDINYNVEPDINSNIPMEFSCPLCQFSTSSEGDIQSHVNQEHVDILSPCTGTDPSQQNSSQPNSGNCRLIIESAHTPEYSCPFCDVRVDCPEELTVHVNAKHMDILSPQNPVNGIGSKARNRMTNSADFCVTCPVCDQEFNDSVILQMHVNGHFSADPTPVQEVTDQALAVELLKSEQEEKDREMKEFHALQAMYGMSGSTNYRKQYEKNLERAVARGDLSVTEFHLRKANMKGRDLNGVDDGHSCTKGILGQLEEYYKSVTTSVVRHNLCHTVDHYSASYGDRGWGCGYRNFQMLLSSMAANPTYCKVLFNGKPQIPSLPKIQRLIESAWEKGFDKQGCEQLGGRVVDTTKWIGATEIAATLLSLKVRCQLLDFHNPSGAQGTHPRLFQWVKDYFRQPSPVKLPLYLQHQGHSRTIVGIEELKDGALRLLIFDPSTSKKQMQLFSGFINSNVMRIIRRTIYGLKAKQYQIVAVTGILEDKEYDENKVLNSERIS